MHLSGCRIYSVEEDHRCWSVSSRVWISRSPQECLAPAYRARSYSKLVRKADQDQRSRHSCKTYSGTEHDLNVLRKEPEVDILSEFDLRHFDLFEAASVLKEARLIRKKSLLALEDHLVIFRPASYGAKRASIHHLFEIVEGMSAEPDLSPETALERLLTYNFFDTVNLYFILHRLREEYGEVLDLDALISP